MEQQTFLDLPTSDIADLLRQAGPKVCAFPFNGTRRWFMLEHGAGEVSLSAYVDAITGRLLEIVRLLFDYGIDTVIMPLLSPHLFDSRGDTYTRVMLDAMALLAERPDFLSFYREYGVRVRFYGDYAAYVAGSPSADLLQKFDDVTRQTAGHHQHRLLWGMCAHDAATTTAALAIRHFQEFGTAPDREALVASYYGELIPPVDLFVTAAKPRQFDVPLLCTGREDLYFTVAPSPYLTERQLREILFDHLYARQKDHSVYDEMQPDDWAAMKAFYRSNQDRTIGVGRKLKKWGLWIPTPQVILPQGVQDVR